jgi:F420-0:gamma-glutamyl ligase-like protein
MTKYRMLAVTTKYWKPRENYLKIIGESVEGKIDDRDLLVISEKAVSTALSNVVDESKVRPSLSAKIIAECWMRIAWGYFLGTLCHLRSQLLQHLQTYPFEIGSLHKQVALQYAGLLRALMFGSEGGIDGSNLAYSYVSLPPRNAGEIAERIREQLWLRLRKKICVMIVDTDKTYSFRNFHFTPRPRPIEGIHSSCGIFAYVLGRTLKLKKRATPLAIAGCKISVEEALEIAEAANRMRGFGAGRTVWDMAARFNVDLADVTWEMLDTVKHKPIVIVKRKR